MMEANSTAAAATKHPGPRSARAPIAVATPPDLGVRYDLLYGINYILNDVTVVPALAEVALEIIREPLCDDSDLMALLLGTTDPRLAGALTEFTRCALEHAVLHRRTLAEMREAGVNEAERLRRGVCMRALLFTAIAAHWTVYIMLGTPSRLHDVFLMRPSVEEFSAHPAGLPRIRAFVHKEFGFVHPLHEEGGGGGGDSWREKLDAFAVDASRCARFLDEIVGPRLRMFNGDDGAVLTEADAEDIRRDYEQRRPANSPEDPPMDLFVPSEDVIKGIKRKIAAYREIWKEVGHVMIMSRSTVGGGGGDGMS